MPHYLRVIKSCKKKHVEKNSCLLGPRVIFSIAGKLSIHAAARDVICLNLLSALLSNTLLVQPLARLDYVVTYIHIYIYILFCLIV